MGSAAVAKGACASDRHHLVGSATRYHGPGSLGRQHVLRHHQLHFGSGAAPRRVSAPGRPILLAPFCVPFVQLLSLLDRAASMRWRSTMADANQGTGRSGFQVPEEMRNMAERSLIQAREALENFWRASRQSAEAMQTQMREFGSAVQSGISRAAPQTVSEADQAASPKTTRGRREEA